MDLIDFDVEKNITELQKIKCRQKLFLVWSPQIFIFPKKLFFLGFFSVLRSFYEKTFFLIQNSGLYRDGGFIILRSPYFQKILCRQ
jgi:hypothetical protein